MEDYSIYNDNLIKNKYLFNEKEINDIIEDSSLRDINAQYLLGMTNLLIFKNFKEGYYWIQEAAKQDHPEAMYRPSESTTRKNNGINLPSLE